MKKILAEILYLTGDLISKSMYKYDMDYLYRPYNWLMLKSYDLDSSNWSEIPKDE